MITTLDLLEKLVAAYPTFKPKNPRLTIQTYLDALEAIDPLVLEGAVNQLIHDQKFFPTVQEISSACRAEKKQAARPDPLRTAVQRLEELYFKTGDLDQADWGLVIERFRSADRPHGAAHAQRRFDGFMELERG